MWDVWFVKRLFLDCEGKVAFEVGNTKNDQQLSQTTQDWKRGRRRKKELVNRQRMDSINGER